MQINDKVQIRKFNMFAVYFRSLNEIEKKFKHVVGFFVLCFFWLWKMSSINFKLHSVIAEKFILMGYCNKKSAFEGLGKK